MRGRAVKWIIDVGYTEIVWLPVSLLDDGTVSLFLKRIRCKLILCLNRETENKGRWNEISLVIVKLKVTHCWACQAEQHVDGMMGHSRVVFASTNKLVSLMASHDGAQRVFACSEFVPVLSCIVELIADRFKIDKAFFSQHIWSDYAKPSSKMKIELFTIWLERKSVHIFCLCLHLVDGGF